MAFFIRVYFQANDDLHDTTKANDNIDRKTFTL